MVTDRFGRRFKSIRVSLTGECNLSCTYCVPEKRCIKEPTYEMSAEELVKVISWLKELLELDKIRLTGGEPLVSKKFDEVLEKVSVMGFKDLSLTTNGQLLKEKIPFLKQHGIKRINVSLDTLDAEKFNRNTRGGILQKTLDGIEEALSHTIYVKVNMVPVKNVNEDEIVTLLDYCLDKGIELRYIELMQMGHLADREKYEKKMLPIQSVFDQISKVYTFEPVQSSIDSTSQRFEIKGKGYFGVIANDSAPFCKHCNRLRLTSTGNIHGCLSSNETFSIIHLLNQPDEAAKKELIIILNQALATKRIQTFDGSSTQMSQVGG